jgi:hypothetical protein
LEEPNKKNVKYQTDFHLEDYFDSMMYEIDCEQYQTALSKVWFKGFEVIKYEHHYYLTYDKIAIYFFENGEVKLENKYNPYNINCIEDLTRHNIEITENFGK